MLNKINNIIVLNNLFKKKIDYFKIFLKDRVVKATGIDYITLDRYGYDIYVINMQTSLNYAIEEFVTSASEAFDMNVFSSVEIYLTHNFAIILEVKLFDKDNNTLLCKMENTHTGFSEDIFGPEKEEDC